MGKLFLAGIGGFIGSSLRYAMTGFVQQWSRSIDFPYGTLAVNLIGCFLIGFLSQLAESRGVFTADSRTFVFIGILGGFTTFSAFGNETEIEEGLATLEQIQIHFYRSGRSAVRRGARPLSY